MKFLINGISVPISLDSTCISDEEFANVAWHIMKRAVGQLAARFHFYIHKKSIDARNKKAIKIVCSVIAECFETLDDRAISKIIAVGFKPFNTELPQISIGTKQMLHRPLIVGGGPAGMFCALMLAENGYMPIVIDRGGTVESRQAAYEKFCTKSILDMENNIQFGAGGAGTFSDGKLTTRINDPRCNYILSRLKEFGAPDDVTIKAKPHIGTDVLKTVVNNIYQRIIDLGGEIIMNCRLDDIKLEDHFSNIAQTTMGDIPFECMVLAIGHSARDTYKMLISREVEIEAKAFSVGVRIEHLQSDIDRALFGDFAGNIHLGHAEYNLSDTNGRGVYTFCMCPGGEVVAAATEQGGLVINGMSKYARDGKNSNAAIAVTVRRDDFGDTVDGAIDFQRSIEQAAFISGGKCYNAPIQTVGDFLNDVLIHEPTKVLPTYMGGNRFTMSDMTHIYPEFVINELKKGITSFGKRIQGFDSDNAILTAAETRTSSPVRILRTEAMTSINNAYIYPCGEGAGYAGGITSAAVDGIKVAEKIISNFKPIKQ